VPPASAILCRLGHVASVQRLRAEGVSAAALRAQVASGVIVRMRRGTYGCAHLDAVTAQAAHVGGAVSCVSVLREAGVWAGHGARAHIQLPPTTARIQREPPGPDGSAPRYHWERPRFGMESPYRVSRLQALWQAIRCLDEEDAIAALESAIHTDFLPTDKVLRLARLAPRRLRNYNDRLVTVSGSGNETIVRLRLERAGHRVEPQGVVPGVGHQDLLVDDCLGLEVDSRAWHDGETNRAIDYDRDLRAAGLGRPTIRIRPSHIHVTWPQTLAVIERAAADAALGLKRRRGRVVVRFDDPL
jgi:hypothetical protein